MGASFRNTNQILELSGCDLLTISPELLAELQAGSSIVSQKLNSANAADALASEKISPLKLDESSFRLQLNNDAMASEKLAEGIRNFCIDTEKLEALLSK
jgi:transaldolase